MPKIYQGIKMQMYDDEKTQKTMNVIFLFGQMIVLAMVYIFVYTSFLAVGFAIEKYSLSPIRYFPVFVALVSFPILLYKYRQMFKSGKMMIATTWMMGTASLTILLLYAYVLILL